MNRRNFMAGILAAAAAPAIVRAESLMVVRKTLIMPARLIRGPDGVQLILVGCNDYRIGIAMPYKVSDQWEQIRSPDGRGYVWVKKAPDGGFFAVGAHAE